MNIVVCIKQVVDVSFPFALNQDTLQPLEEDLFYRVNPADRCALELALSLTERFGGTVTLLSYGPPRVERALKQCLALGGHKALRVWEDGVEQDSQSKAYLLAKAAESLSSDLVLCGSKSIDEGTGATPGAIAEWLDLPQVTAVTDLDFAADEKSVTVQRKLERGRREKVHCPLPAVLAVEDGVAQPRYGALTSLLDAARTSISVVDGAAVGADSYDVREIDGLRKEVRRALPRPRPKKTFNLESGLTAEQRMELMMSGGGRKGKSDLLEGAPMEVAQQLAEIMKEKLYKA